MWLIKLQLTSYSLYLLGAPPDIGEGPFIPQLITTAVKISVTITIGFDDANKHPTDSNYL